MQPKRRQKDRPRRSFFRPPPAAGAGAFSRPGASVSFVSDGPISSNSGRNGGKNAGRNCVSALPQRATPDSDFPHLLAGITFHHRCRSKGLRVRSPARRLTRPLAPATAEIFRSCRRSRRRGYFAQRRKRFLCLRRPHFFQQRKKWGKERRQKLRFCTSSARYARQRFPASSRGHNLSSPLSVKRTACTLTGAEADAAACFSHGRNFPLLPPHPQAFPLWGPRC